MAAPSVEKGAQDPTRPNEPLLPTWDEVREAIEDPGIGPEGLVGVAFEVRNRGIPNYSFVTPDETPGSKLYVIGEVQCDQQVRSERLVRTGVPLAHKRGGIFNPGRKARFRRPTSHETRYVLYKLKPTHQEDDGVMVYDELQDVRVYSQSDLQEFIQNNNAAFADPDVSRAEIPRHESQPDPRYPSHEIELDVSTNPDVFAAMTEQLEDEDIQNWTGLRWRSHWRVPHATAADPHATRTLSRNVEVVRETLLMKHGDKKDATGDSRDFRPIRALVVQESDDHGIVLATRVVPIDDHFPGFFRHFREHGGWITDMRIDKQERPLPWGANDLTDRLDEAESALEYIDAPDRIATWLLSYADMVNGDGPGAEDARLDRLGEVGSTPESRRRLETVKEMVAHYGAARIYRLASALRDDFVASAGELGLRTDITDTTGKIKTQGNSISWVIEGLADQYYYDSHRAEAGEDREGLEFGHALLAARADRTTAGLRQRDIVDQRVGSALMDAVMHWPTEPEPEVIGIHPRTLQPAYRIKDPKLLFHGEKLEDTPKLTRRQVKELEETIYRTAERRRTVRLAHLVAVGRLLRRGVGR